VSAVEEPDDGTLALRAQAGDQRAFSQLMRRHKEPLYRFVRRYVGDADEAYDLLQESFTSAWKALKRYDQSRPFPTWLRRIALNKCRDWSRRRAVRAWLTKSDALDSPSGAKLADLGPTPEEALAERDALRALDAAVAALPRALKESLILTVLDGLPQQEVSELLGISRKAVELRVYRARRVLAQSLGLAPLE
jgi:RNA polymerase sigma-70 factor (ECF subfamily)